MSYECPWISIEEEWPPNDGWYEVCNFPEKVNKFERGDPLNLPNEFMAILEYDGLGFKSDGFYRYPKFWRHSRRQEKLYGKVVK